MILGIGTDLCEVARMEHELAREGAGFRDQVFTAGEIAYCEGMRFPAQHYAARFAAKEAVAKALDVAGSERFFWREVEITRDAAGRPGAVLHGSLRQLAEERGVGRIVVSLSHTRELAVACATVEARVAAEGEGGSSA